MTTEEKRTAIRDVCCSFIQCISCPHNGNYFCANYNMIEASETVIDDWYRLFFAGSANISPTTDEKRKKLSAFCDEQDNCGCCPLCDCVNSCEFYDESMTDEEIDAAYAIAFPDDSTPRIKDSGDRTEFPTGAVRDMREGKGRCDLMPLDVVARVCASRQGEANSIIADISLFQEFGDIKNLYFVLHTVASNFGGYETMLLEVAKHFEEGAKKYGENNWQKGIPVRCYIDSAVRHYLKWLRGDTDEPHDRAFVWNIMCCIWTCEHKPELNDYAKDDEQ